MTGASFYSATLTNANLSGTHLEGADFRNADLRGANLCNLRSRFRTLWSGALTDGNTQCWCGTRAC